jgi:hypothetical protein
MKSLRMDKLAGIRKLAQNVDTSKKYKVTSDGVAWQEYNDNSGKPYPIDDSEPRRIVAGVWIYYNPKDINLSGSTKDDLLKKTLASYDGEKEAQEAVNTLTSIPASPNYSAIKDLLPTARGVAYQITDKSVEKEFKEKFLTEWYKKTPNLGYTQADWDYYGPKLAENIWREYQESDVSNNTTTTGGSSNGSTKSKSSGGTSGSNKTQLAAPKDTQLSDNWGTYTVKGPFEFDWVKSSDGSK